MKTEKMSRVWPLPSPLAPGRQPLTGPTPPQSRNDSKPQIPARELKRSTMSRSGLLKKHY